jgi:hypothetical protein
MPSAASSQQLALGGSTAAEAAHHLAEGGYNELPENGCRDYATLVYIPKHSLTN